MSAQAWFVLIVVGGLAVGLACWAVLTDDANRPQTTADRHRDALARAVSVADDDEIEALWRAVHRQAGRHV